MDLWGVSFGLTRVYVCVVLICTRALCVLCSRYTVSSRMRFKRDLRERFVWEVRAFVELLRYMENVIEFNGHIDVSLCVHKCTRIWKTLGAREVRRMNVAAAAFVAGWSWPSANGIPCISARQFLIPTDS